MHPPCLAQTWPTLFKSSLKWKEKGKHSRVGLSLFRCLTLYAVVTKILFILIPNAEKMRAEGVMEDARLGFLTILHLSPQPITVIDILLDLNKFLPPFSTVSAPKSKGSKSKRSKRCARSTTSAPCRCLSGLTLAFVFVWSGSDLFHWCETPHLLRKHLHVYYTIYCSLIHYSLICIYHNIKFIYTNTKLSNWPITI